MLCSVRLYHILSMSKKQKWGQRLRIIFKHIWKLSQTKIKCFWNVDNASHQHDSDGILLGNSRSLVTVAALSKFCSSLTNSWQTLQPWILSRLLTFCWGFSRVDIFCWRCVDTHDDLRNQEVSKLVLTCRTSKNIFEASKNFWGPISFGRAKQFGGQKSMYITRLLSTHTFD